MPETFDPYHRWLGIPPEEQPPGYYRLLGVKLFESDADVIDSAVNRQMAHLRTFQGGPHAALSQRLLNEVATARVCLLNPTKKAAYDNSLRPAPRIVSAARLSSTPASPPPLPTRAVNLVQAAVGDAEADSEEPFDIAGLVQQAKRVPKRSAQPAEAGRPGGDERKKARISPTAIGAIVAGSLVLGALILFLIMLIATKPAEPTVAAKTGPSQSPPSANESAPSRHAVPAKSSSSTSAAGPTDASHSEPSGKRASPTGAPPPSKPESNDTVDVTANPKAIQEAARLSEQRALDGQDTVLKASYAASVAEKAKLLAKASAIFEEIRPRFVDALNASVSLRDSPGPGTTREDARIMVGENRLTLAMVDFYLAQTQQSGPARTAALTTCIKEFDDIYQDHRERFVGWRAHVWHARILQELGQPSDAKDIYEEVVSCDERNIEEMDGSKAAVRTRALRRTGMEGFFADVEQYFLQTLCQLDKKEYLEEVERWRSVHKANSEKCFGFQALTLEYARNALAMTAHSKEETKEKAKKKALSLLNEMAKIPSPYQEDAIKFRRQIDNSDTQPAGNEPKESHSPSDEARSEDHIDVIAANHSDWLSFGARPQVADVSLETGEDGVSRVSSFFGGRSSGSRKKMLACGGGTVHTERAVLAALVWLANHQLSDGSWSLKNYVTRCNDGGRSCTGPGSVNADAGATSMGLLPFLAAGQTHRSGHFKDHIGRGIQWLVSHQQPDGNLAKGCDQMMYSHGLATITLCEAFGLSGDRPVGIAAQGAVNFILAAQNTADGGWRYNPKDPGDTSVVGWQLMALKSAHMAGLNVGGSVFANTSKWLDSVAVHDGTEYSYQPGNPSSNTMTSVSLLCRQYLGAKRDNPTLVGGMAYLLAHLPDEGFPNVYYWYYATQVMHNMSGYEWDTWNRKMRDLLVHTQVRNVDSCANGSWAPEKDAWGKTGGRVMTTALSCLTLEIYYRYRPLFAVEQSPPTRTATELQEPKESGEPAATRTPDEEHLPSRQESKQEELSLFAVTDLVFLVGHPPSQKKSGRASGGINSPFFFKVTKDGVPPEHGFFNVDGKAVPVVWKSTSPRVVRVDQRDELVGFTFLSAGKATVSVAAGKLSAKKTVEVRQLPFWLGVSANEFIKAYGVADEKTSELPSGSWGLGAISGEVWEYKKWPRCLITVENSQIAGVHTRPATNEVEESDLSSGTAGKTDGSSAESRAPSGGAGKIDGSSAKALAEHLQKQHLPITEIHQTTVQTDGRYVLRFQSDQLARGIGYVHIVPCGDPDTAAIVIDAPVNREMFKREPAYGSFVYQSFAILGSADCVELVRHALRSPPGK